MAQSDDRWVEVSKSAFAHETDGLAMLRYVVPKASPYRAWTNFEFMDNHGQWHEIDALVLGRRRLHLVESGTTPACCRAPRRWGHYARRQEAHQWYPLFLPPLGASAWPRAYRKKLLRSQGCRPQR